MNEQWTPWSILSATGGAGVTTEGWNLAESAEEPRTFVTEVIFSAPFQSVPVVQLALTGFDMDQRDSGRISIKAVEVSPAGFKVEISTWLDTRVYAVEFSWLAIGA